MSEGIIQDYCVSLWGGFNDHEFLTVVLSISNGVNDTLLLDFAI